MRSIRAAHLECLREYLNLNDCCDSKFYDVYRWAPNLDTLSWLLVDRVYIGAFAEPAGPLNVLEYLLSMLQLANTDGRVEDATPIAKSMLFTRSGGRQAEAYVQSLLKNTNRMLMFCFLPQLISNPTEEDASIPNGKKIDKSSSGSEIIVEGVPKSPGGGSGDNGVAYQVTLDKTAVLQLLLANRKIIFCTINVDLDLVCALCINLFAMALDNEQTTKPLVVEVWKALLAHRSAALEDVLITRGNQVHLTFEGSPSYYFSLLLWLCFLGLPMYLIYGSMI